MQKKQVLKNEFTAGHQEASCVTYVSGFQKPHKERPQGMMFLRTCQKAGFILTLFFSSCTGHLSLSSNYGLQNSYRAYIPARIAILPCSLWPQAGLLPAKGGESRDELILTTVDGKETGSLCQAFNRSILAGFSQQPYMMGYSPQAVEKQLQILKKENLLQVWPSLWQAEDSNCSSTNSPVPFYVCAMQGKAAWLKWLLDFSQTVKNSDAVLMPFLLYASEQNLDDRGFPTMMRKLAFAMFLVDTRNAELIWSNAGYGELRNQFTPSLEPMPYPSWDDLVQQALSGERIWSQFPGRLSP
ncbi:MAG: hypothetical protein KA436_06450 [Oligoflexales bacterium]|nr:hypothetical protein [Oligoflexales bacterium]